MSILKIHLQRQPDSDSHEKYLLTFIPELHYNIRAFLQFAKKTLDIDTAVQSLVLMEKDGYMLPHSLDASLLREGGYFQIKVRQRRSELKVNSLWTAQKLPGDNIVPSDQLVVPLLQSMDVEAQSSQSTPRFSQKATPNLFQKYLTNETKQIKPNKGPNSQHEQDKQEVRPNKKKKKNMFSQESSSDEELPRVNNKKQKKVQKIATKKKSKTVMRAPPCQPSQPSQSSLQSSQQDQVHLNDLSGDNHKRLTLQSISQMKKQQTIQRTKKNQPTKQDKRKDGKEQVNQDKQMQIQGISRQHKPIQSIDAHADLTVKKSQDKKIKRKVISDDIQSSEESSQQHKADRLKQKRPTEDKAQLNLLKNKMTAKNVNQKVPSALRNKLQKSFKDHQTQQWIELTQQIMTRSGSEVRSFLKVGNLIRFKEIELDEVKFIPKQSEWIEGTIKKITEGKFLLEKVSQPFKPYRQNYEVRDINMVQLQINSKYAEPAQMTLLKGQNQSTHNLSTQPTSQKSHSQQGSKEVEVAMQEQNRDKSSIEKFICGQVQYYFGEKNYPTDLFMHMHQNRDPQRFISLKFFLNCPKIKKVLKSEDKLLQYLSEDEKRAERNFQLDEATRRVRRKISLKTQNIQHIQQSVEPVVQQNEQPQVSNQSSESLPMAAQN